MLDADLMNRGDQPTAPAIDRHLARNIVAILYALDRHEIDPVADDLWCRFRGDPCRTFLKANDGWQERIWAAIEARLPVGDFV